MLSDLLIGGLLVALGFGLGFIPPHLDRNRRMKLHWQALRAENLIAAERVTAFLNDEVMSPLYRFPLRAYDAALKALLTDAADLTPDELKVLTEAADLIGDINRGLDYCAELTNDDRLWKKLQQQHNRNKTKAERLKTVVLPVATRLVHEKLNESSNDG